MKTNIASQGKHCATEANALWPPHGHLCPQLGYCDCPELTTREKNTSNIYNYKSWKGPPCPTTRGDPKIVTGPLTAAAGSQFFFCCTVPQARFRRIPPQSYLNCATSSPADAQQVFLQLGVGLQHCGAYMPRGLRLASGAHRSYARQSFTDRLGGRTTHSSQPERTSPQ